MNPLRAHPTPVSQKEDGVIFNTPPSQSAFPNLYEHKPPFLTSSLSFRNRQSHGVSQRSTNAIELMYSSEIWRTELYLPLCFDPEIEDTFDILPQPPRVGLPFSGIPQPSTVVAFSGFDEWDWSGWDSEPFEAHFGFTYPLDNINRHRYSRDSSIRWRAIQTKAAMTSRSF
ncbi:hypothetical protein GQ43DRAFT_179304 [Delitschia confertaspora ATCC 74209]|uniref:Uncharacterized protein n=1 Tax=Delitschia confertaspora ATCC 74209 TaxID=1513339 RepID=A0A9P4MSH3_9PLEO|nr:hypothetical protein GQ43DRAFT_179304 [Delitschia confertaspora ATCC 74209]